MKNKTAGEKLYEVENLMKTAVGLNEKLSLDEVDALLVDMKLWTGPDDDGQMILTMNACCDVFVFEVSGVTFDQLVDRALQVANAAVGEAAEEIKNRPRQDSAAPASHLQLIYSA